MSTLEQELPGKKLVILWTRQNQQLVEPILGPYLSLLEMEQLPGKRLHLCVDSLM